jgi:protoheme ferro-lyase
MCHEFTAHFTASTTHPKIVAFLEAIVQGKSEPFRDYIERFNKETVYVQGASESMKRYLIAKGLK